MNKATDFSHYSMALLYSFLKKERPELQPARYELEKTTSTFKRDEYLQPIEKSFFPLFKYLIQNKNELLLHIW